MKCLAVAWVMVCGLILLAVLCGGCAATGMVPQQQYKYSETHWDSTSGNKVYEGGYVAKGTAGILGKGKGMSDFTWEGRDEAGETFVIGLTQSSENDSRGDVLLGVVSQGLSIAGQAIANQSANNSKPPDTGEAPTLQDLLTWVGGLDNAREMIEDAGGLDAIANFLGIGK
jgi:hypothetical protein